METDPLSLSDENEGEEKSYIYNHKVMTPSMKKIEMVNIEF